MKNYGGMPNPQHEASTCRLPDDTYTFDRSNGQLSWKICVTADPSSTLPTYTFTEGTTTLSAAQVAQVDTALAGIAISTPESCGADKPELSVTVTSTETKTYIDDFDSCRDTSQTYVSGLDPLNDAFFSFSRR